MSFPCRIAGLSFRDGVTRELLKSRAAAPPHREKPVESVQTSGQGDFQTPPWGGLAGMTNQEEAQGRPGTRWRDYVSQQVWEHLSILPEEAEEVAGPLALRYALG